MWQIIVDELAQGLPSQNHLIRVGLRLLVAMLLGACIGWNRERIGKAAGWRTHVLVALGSALFVMAPEEAGFEREDMSRVIQGVATGIGFIGAGAILKLESEKEIQGLTTAAGLYVTSAIGIAVGLGRLGIAILATVMALAALAMISAINRPQEE